MFGSAAFGWNIVKALFRDVTVTPRPTKIAFSVEYSEPLNLPMGGMLTFSFSGTCSTSTVCYSNPSSSLTKKYYILPK